MQIADTNPERKTTQIKAGLCTSAEFLDFKARLSKRIEPQV